MGDPRFLFQTIILDIAYKKDKKQFKEVFDAFYCVDEADDEDDWSPIIFLHPNTEKASSISSLLITYTMH